MKKILNIAAILFLAASAASAVDFIEIHAFSGSMAFNGPAQPTDRHGARAA